MTYTSTMRMRILVAFFAVAMFAGFAMGRVASSPSPRRESSKGVVASPPVAAPVDTNPVAPLPAPPGAPEPFAAPAPPPDAVSKAQDSILDFLFPLISDEERLRQGFFSVIYRDHKAQDQLLELLLTYEDPEVVEAAGEFAIWARKPDQLQRIADAFSTTPSPERRAALGMALGNSALDPIARPHIESVLMGNNAGLQAAVLQRMSVGSMLKDPVLTERWGSRIREFLATADAVPLRVAAAGALRGDPSQEARRLLIDRMLHDPSPDVQERCAWTLPLDRETIDLSWAAVRDEVRTPGVRRAAARLILNAGDRRLITLTDEQRKTLQHLSLSR